MHEKILDIQQIPELSDQLKADGQTIVHCHGVFDLLHPGHMKHFAAAKRFGDVLVVSLTEDKNVNKGPDRPIFKEALRAESIAALAVVDYVFINREPTAGSAITALKPNFYVKGQDYKNAAEDFSGGILKEKEMVEQFGGHLVFTEEEQFSSSKLINRHLSDEDAEVKNYLTSLRKRLNFDGIKSKFDEIAKYKVMVIGDIILDEYQFVHPLGKASKSSTITAKSLNNEMYAGGALAVANHISNFVDEVTLVSSYGINKGRNHYDFIKSHLNANVKDRFVYTPERPTTLKRRFVVPVFSQKLFEEIEIEDQPMTGEERSDLMSCLHDIESYDLVLMADFGHGLIDQELIRYIASKDVFLAVNAQTNSANQGYNLLTKYDQCDYFSIDRGEAHLAANDKFAAIDGIQKELYESVNAKVCAITLGVDGCIVYDGDKTVTAPILNSEIVDTIGAGDAYLSITALLARHSGEVEEIAFVGNAVGSLAVKILGNKRYIEKLPLLKYLKTLLT